MRFCPLVVALLVAHACSPSKKIAPELDDPNPAGGRDAQASSDAHSPDADVIEVGPCAPAASDAPANDPFRRARTTSDLPDDSPGEYQVHLLYVEPSDRAAATRLDEDGSIRRSATAFNSWLAARTDGPKFRMDTCKGWLDVTYFKLPQPFTERVMAQGTTLAPKGTVYLRDRLEAELKKTFHHRKKIYLVYYDGLSFGHCGGAPTPPLLVGQFPALFMGGLFAASFLTEEAKAGATHVTVFDPAQAGLQTGSYAAKLDDEPVSVASVNGTTVTLGSPLASSHAAGAILIANDRAPDCRDNPFSSDGVALGYTEYSGAHELLHTVGIVSTAAKYYSTSAPNHLTEASAGGTADVMYQGSLPWACSGNTHANPAASPCVLDPEYENYWKVPAESAMVDLARSVFLDPTPANAVAPVGW